MLYKVVIKSRLRTGIEKTNIYLWEQDHLDQIIGRYTRQYDPPLELDSNIPECTSLQFYKKFSSRTDYICADISFRKATKEDVAQLTKTSARSEEVTKPNVINLPPYTPLPVVPQEPEIIPDLLKPFIDAKVLYKTT